MKKSLLFLIAILSGFIGNAQISLTSANHAPLVGDSTIIVAYNPFGPTVTIPQNTGANQTWNFYNIGLDSTNTYVHKIEAPGTNAPSGTTSSENSQSGVKRHFKNSSNQLDIRGIVTSIGININFNGDLLYRTWPMAYGATFTDSEAGTYTNTTPYLPPSGSSNTFTKSVASGYGTLIAPNAVTFNNVLQVLDSTIILISESVYDPFTMIPYQVDLNLYYYSMSYYVSGLKYPVIAFAKSIFEYTSVNLQTGQIEVFNVDSTGILEYNKNPYSAPTGVFLTANENELKMFPNPASNVLNILSNENATIEIYSMDGRLIDSQSIQGNLIINVSEYANGMYVVRSVDANGNVSQQKFVKQ
jgi:hypothetical protein